MPIYEYECSKCGKVSEIIQKISEDPVKDCPDCGGSVERLISRSSFHLKGGGWYASGYDKSPAKSSDAKPETKPETKSSDASATPSVKKDSSGSGADKS